MYDHLSLKRAISAAILALMGCNAATTTAVPGVEIETPSGLQFHVSNDEGLKSIDVDVTRISCNGEPIEPFSMLATIPLTNNADGVTNALFELDPGCYRVVAKPSPECAFVTSDEVLIVGGMTTELGISFQCGTTNIGAIDAYASVVADVIAARFTLEGAPCDNENIEPETFVQTIHVAKTQSAIFNAFFIAPPGCYALRVDPLTADFAPSDNCQTSSMSKIVVIDGTTTEVGTEFVCQ